MSELWPESMKTLFKKNTVNEDVAELRAMVKRLSERVAQLELMVNGLPKLSPHSFGISKPGELPKRLSECSDSIGLPLSWRRGL